MKKIIQSMLYASILMMFVAGCNKKNEPDPEPTGEVEMVSFGFYAEDNAALTEDYFVLNPGLSFEIRLPEGTDKTALVARFVVTDDDVVSIGSTVLTSGVTPFDYTLPVDITVKDPVINRTTVHSLAVKKILKMIWTKVGEYTAASATAGTMTTFAATSMDVNPVTGEPYIAFQHGTGATANKISVIKWNGTAFEQVGSPQFSADAGRYPTMRFAPDGTPYVMYYDYSTSPANKATMMSFSSGAWTPVGGSAGYADAANTSYAGDFVVYGTEKKIISGYAQNAAVGSMPRREVNVSYWNGAAWTANTQVPGGLLPAGDTYAATNVRMTKFGNNIYMVVALNGAGYSVLKYDITTAAWTLLGDKLTFGGATGIYLSDLTIACDNTGALYVGAPDQSSNAIRVAKYSGTGTDNAAWPVIGGGPISRATGSNTNFKLAFDAQNNPYLLYITRESSSDPYTANVVTIDKESLAWSAKTQLMSGISAEPMSMRSASNGDIYVSFVSRPASAEYIYYIYKYAMEADE